MIILERGMIMYKAVGWHSQNVYMTGNSLAEVMRKLQEKYLAPKRTSKGLNTQQIYNEPLRLIDETGQDKQYLA